jgi:hypothetical protein
MCLLFSLTFVAAGNGITPDEKSSSPAANPRPLATGKTPQLQRPAVPAERSVAKENGSAAPVRKAKRRSKQVIIVIVVDDQESSWI